MKDHALKHLAESGLSYPEADTKWVLTVPAIWSDPAKILMRNAAEKVSHFLLPIIAIVLHICGRCISYLDHNK